MFNQFYQNIFFNGLDVLRGRKTIKKLKFLRQSQYWEKKKLDQWQLEKLNKLIDYAKQNSEFYAKKLEKIKTPLKKLNELQALPILTKQDIRNDKKKILCKNSNMRKMELCKTGGSTGEPLLFYLDWNSKDWNRGSVYRDSEWAGINLGEKTIQMVGSHYDLNEFKKLKWKLIFFMQRYKDLPVAMVNEEIYDRYFKMILRYKPTSIWGYASAIYLFSEFIKNEYPNAELDFIKAIITSSETLYSTWKKDINSVFNGMKVFDHYGSREAYIAAECKAHTGYHINAEVIILEIVDNDGNRVGPGELGKIVITDLSNYSFPFIRYEIGDTGIMDEYEKCSCGISLPKLKSVEGRISDILVFKDRIITPHFNDLIFQNTDILQYQVIQKKYDEIIVKIIKSDTIDNSNETKLKDSLKMLVGSDIKIHIDYVEEIQLPISGKRRYVISEIGLQ